MGASGTMVEIETEVPRNASLRASVEVKEEDRRIAVLTRLPVVGRVVVAVPRGCKVASRLRLAVMISQSSISEEVPLHLERERLV